MLDDVLRWLVRVTGLELRLLTLTAILIVYSASIYLNAKEKTGAATPAPRPVELGELASAVERVERGLETVAKYLVNLEKPSETQPRFQLRHEYEAFIPPPVAGAPPRSHHRPDPRPPAPPMYSSPPKFPQHYHSPQYHDITDSQEQGDVELPIAPQADTPKRVRHILSQPEEDFFLPLPTAEPQPEQPTPPLGEPSTMVMETLRRMSRKAGRTP